MTSPQIHIPQALVRLCIASLQYLLQPGNYAIIVEHVIAWELPHIFPNTVIFFTYRTFQT